MKSVLILVIGLSFISSCASHSPDRDPAQANAPTDSIKQSAKEEAEIKKEDLGKAPEDLEEKAIKPQDGGASPIQFGFMHTKPDCQATSTTASGKVIKHKVTFCKNENGEDQKRIADLSGMEDTIVKMLQTTKRGSTVFVAYFSFSNKKVQRELCATSARGANVRVFLDNGSNGQIDTLIMNEPKCIDPVTKKLNVKLTYLGGNTTVKNAFGSKGFWQLHHNKFLFIDNGDKEVMINFSSGNLSAFGTSLHLDHWVTLKAPRDSNIANAHVCVMQGLEAATDAQKKMIEAEVGAFEAAGTVDQRAVSNAYINKRESCFKANNVMPRDKRVGKKKLASDDFVAEQVIEVLAREKIAPVFSPNNDNGVADAFIATINALDKGEYLYIAIQHFLHSEIKNAIIAAGERGAEIRLVMDDDALRGESEVPGVDKLIRELDGQENIEIRLAETNKQAGGNGSMMHNKLAIINGEMTFSGAGHYTRAALRDNWENFYFVSDVGTIQSYSKYFKFLWDNSVDIAYTESRGEKDSSAPGKLNDKFLTNVK